VIKGESHRFVSNSFEDRSCPSQDCETVEDAREFLCRFLQSGDDLRRTIAVEMTQGGWGVPSPAMTHTDLITAAAREIASRRIQVVVVLPENPIIRFDDQASHDRSFDDVVFVNWAVASAFLAALPTDSQLIAALERALAHDSASAWVRNGRALQSASKTLGADRILDEVASLLAAGFLLLLPLDAARRAFRLVWRRPSMPRRSAAKSVGDAPRLAPLRAFLQRLRRRRRSLHRGLAASFPSQRHRIRPKLRR
jgi:hypothetical protein